MSCRVLRHLVLKCLLNILSKVEVSAYFTLMSGGAPALRRIWSAISTGAHE